MSFRMPKRSFQEWKLFLEACFWLSLWPVLIKMIPFRYYAKNTKLDYGESAPEKLLLSRIGWAVERSAACLPWHPVCLPRALAVRSMLRRRKIPFSLYLGVSTGGENNTLKAHAWIESSGKILSGKQGYRQYTEIFKLS